MTKLKDTYNKSNINKQLEVIEYEIEGIEREISQMDGAIYDEEFMDEVFNLTIKKERLMGFLTGCNAILKYIED